MENLEKEIRTGREHAVPALLDVVKLDGRWAQVRGGGGAILFLDNGEARPIEWGNYRMVRSFGASQAIDFVQEQGERFTDEEIERVHWGPEEERHPELKKQVRVFGEYVSKEPSE
jgi:hypothetical protein